MYAYINVCIYIYIYIYIHIHTYIYIYILPSLHPSFHPSIPPSFHPSINPSRMHAMQCNATQRNATQRNACMCLYQQPSCMHDSCMYACAYANDLATCASGLPARFTQQRLCGYRLPIIIHNIYIYI